MSHQDRSVKRNRGIYLLPNLFTTAALFSGFYAVLAAMNGKFEQASVAIFVGMVLDGLDGRVARLTNTQTPFGAEYDSLSDMVAFGLAPSLVVYVWSLSELGKLGWLAAFIYTVGAALRLARFNTQVATSDKRYFQGLPSPAAAAVVAGGVWMGVDYGIPGEEVSYLAVLLTGGTGLLMVSNLRYHSFKEVDLRGKVPFVSIVVIAVGFSVLQVHPPLLLFLMFLMYACSGPVLTLIHLRQRRANRRSLSTSKEDER
ncbi:MAG: CDP-diacylglycerol--serine O-phosphatidyltransferase [Gammaproteobacteria bacterium]|nr:CDP-diacylglycerol--serine O-phosphatidyltransferase [Gammaproteobacteria bacterium]